MRVNYSTAQIFPHSPNKYIQKLYAWQTEAERFILGSLLKAEFNFIGPIKKISSIVMINLCQQLIIPPDTVPRLGSGYQYHNRMVGCGQDAM